MGLITSLSKALNTSVEKILEKDIEGLYDISIVFTSTENRAFKLEIDYFENLSIDQNFMAHYTDVITLEIKFRISEYLELIKNVKGLRCRIEFRNVDRKSLTVGVPVLEIDQKAIMKDKSDILKKYPKGELVPTEDSPESEAHLSNFITTEIDLIDDAVYKMRKRRINFIARGTTIEDILLLLAQTFEMKTVYIVPPDNKKTYENFVIPPMLSIAEILAYIQNHDSMGIYDTDVGYYITGKVLYIYPLMDTKPKSPTTVHAYNVGAGMYDGCESYHMEERGDIHFVSNVGSEDIELIYEGIENTGNSFIVQPLVKLLDKWREMSEVKYKINEDNLETIDLEVSEGMDKGVYSPVFKSTDNMHKLCTEMASNYLTLINLGWNHAIPMTFKPGWKVVYHYDGDGQYQVREGVCNAVNYQLKPLDSVGKKLYACRAGISLSISNRG